MWIRTGGEVRSPRVRAGSVHLISSPMMKFSVRVTLQELEAPVDAAVAVREADEIHPRAFVMR
jgi:hypothetical protein